MHERRTGRFSVLWTFALSIATVVAIAAPTVPAKADSGAAFVGGLIGGAALSRRAQNQRRQTEAMEAQADAAQRSAASPPPAAAPAPASASPQQRLAELDKLAAGGFITKEEYQRKRQAIIDSM